MAYKPPLMMMTNRMYNFNFNAFPISGWGRSTLARVKSRALLIAIILTITSLFVPQATAQESVVTAPPDPLILAIEFNGLRQTTESYALDVSGLNVGQTLDRDPLDDAVNRLLRTGRFIRCTYDVVEESGGVRVVFQLLEQLKITAIELEGNTKLGDQRLRQLLDVNVGDRIDALAIKDGANAIAAEYREAGYSDVTVSYDEDQLSETGRLIYRITEGQRVRIRRVKFEGNTVFSAEILRRKVQTKKAMWIFRSGAFDENRAEADAAALRNFYHNEGFLDARAGYRRDPGDDNESLTVVFSIEEGTRYRIEDIRFRGNVALGSAELADLMTSAVGEIVKPPQVQDDARRIQTRYGEMGYIYASVQPIQVFSNMPGFVLISFDIEEGEQFRVGEVVIRGNSRTRDKVVRRELDLYPPDDLFNLSAAKEAERNLVQNRIFSSARVFPVGDEPGVRDVIVDVVESDKLGDFIFGAGVTSNSGVVGTIALEMNNFDIADWPRSWSELFRFRSFTGAGQRLRLELQPGRQVSQFNLDFTDPYFLDRPIRFDLGLHLFQRGRDGYDEERKGGLVSFGRRFRRGVLQDWFGEIALRTEIVKVDGLDVLADRDIRNDEGSNLLTSLKATLVRDRTDNRLVPATGDRLSLSYEQFGVLGGDHYFGRVSTSYTRYYTLSEDALERKSVLRLHSQGGLILGDAPVFERFYAGGTGSIRGFEFRGAGPHEGIKKNAVGGDFLILANAEYSFPLYEKTLRGLLFVDSGTVDSRTYRISLGTGVRLTLDIFGPVALEFSIAAPLTKDDDDERQVFSFAIGRIF